MGIEGGADPPIRQIAEAEIAAYLGRRTAESAVRIAARSWLSVEPESLARQHLAPLCEGLRPMLKTLLGADVAGAVIEKIRAGVER